MKKIFEILGIIFVIILVCNYFTGKKTVINTDKKIHVDSEKVKEKVDLAIDKTVDIINMVSPADTSSIQDTLPGTHLSTPHA